MGVYWCNNKNWDGALGATSLQLRSHVDGRVGKAQRAAEIDGRAERVKVLEVATTRGVLADNDLATHRLAHRAHVVRSARVGHRPSRLGADVSVDPRREGVIMMADSKSTPTRSSFKTKLIGTPFSP